MRSVVLQTQVSVDWLFFSIHFIAMEGDREQKVCSRSNFSLAYKKSKLLLFQNLYTQFHISLPIKTIFSRTIRSTLFRNIFYARPTYIKWSLPYASYGIRTLGFLDTQWLSKSSLDYIHLTALKCLQLWSTCIF